MTRVDLYHVTCLEVEWTIPTSVHQVTLYELIIATYQFPFLLLFGLLLLKLLLSYLSDILFSCARNNRMNKFHSITPIYLLVS